MNGQWEPQVLKFGCTTWLFSCLKLNRTKQNKQNDIRITQSRPKKYGFFEFLVRTENFNFLKLQNKAFKKYFRSIDLIDCSIDLFIYWLIDWLFVFISRIYLAAGWNLLVLEVAHHPSSAASGNFLASTRQSPGALPQRWRPLRRPAKYRSKTLHEPLESRPGLGWSRLRGPTVLLRIQARCVSFDEKGPPFSLWRKSQPEWAGE